MAQQPAGERLEGWRAIADHLGKSVRTAQRWEEEHALPVHRRHSPDDHQAAQVFSSAGELDAWWTKTFNNGGVVEVPLRAVDGGGPALAASRAAGWRAARWGIGLAVAALAVSTLLSLSSPPRPHALRAIESNAFAVYDDEEQQIWTKVFAARFLDLPVNDAILGQVTDLDDDGFGEVLFAFNSVGSHPGPEDGLYCYGPTGTVLWKYDPDRSINIYGYAHDDTFAIRHLATGTDDAGETFIVVVAVHRPNAPSHVAVLGADGETIGEYWHYGYPDVVLVDDFDGDGDDDILLGGVNNAIADPEAARHDLARQQAVIALIEHDIDAAISPGPVDYPAELRRNQELLYIAFPFPTVFDVQAVGSRVLDMRARDDGIVIRVDGADGQTSGLVYELDRRFELVRMDAAEGVQPSHEAHLESGFVDLGLEQERERLQRLERLVWRFPGVAGSVAGSH